MVLEKSPNLLVIACGLCYLMNPDYTKPVAVFGVGFDGIFKANHDRIVLSDNTDFTIVEADGTHWKTETISWDGLKELRVEHNIVSGLAYDPMDSINEWKPFSYDIDTRVLTGGTYNQYFTKKPWWKIFVK